MDKEKIHKMAIPNLRTQRSSAKAEKRETQLKVYNQTDNETHKNEHQYKSNGIGKFTNATEETTQGYKCLGHQQHYLVSNDDDSYDHNRDKKDLNNVGTLFEKEINETEGVVKLHVDVLDKNEDCNNVLRLDKSAVLQLEEHPENKTDKRQHDYSLALSQHEGVENVSESIGETKDVKTEKEDIFKDAETKDVNTAKNDIQGIHIPEKTYKNVKENCSFETNYLSKTFTCVLQLHKEYLFSQSEYETSSTKYVDWKTYLHENLYSYFYSNIQIHALVYAIGYRMEYFPVNPLTLKHILRQPEQRNTYLEDESFRFATFSLSSSHYKLGLIFSLAAWGFFYDIDGIVKCYSCGHLYNFSQGQESESTSHNHNCICRFSEGHAGRTLADYYGASIGSRIVSSGDAQPEDEQLRQSVDVSVRSQNITRPFSIRSLRLGYTQEVSNEDQVMDSLQSRRTEQTQTEVQTESAVRASPDAETMACQETARPSALLDSLSISVQRATTEPLELQTDSKGLHRGNIGDLETSRQNTTNDMTSISSQDTKPTAHFVGKSATNCDEKIETVQARHSLSGDDCMPTDAVSLSNNTEETHKKWGRKPPQAESTSQIAGTSAPTKFESLTCGQEDFCKTDSISVNSSITLNRESDYLPTEEANRTAQAASTGHDTHVFICAWPGYASLEQRISSFKKCDKLKNIARYLAEIGLFCKDASGCTHCYKCGGILKNWEPDDDPVLEHARWFPGCSLSSQHQTAGHFHNVEREQRMSQSLAQREEERNIIEEILDSDVCMKILERYRRTVVAEAVRQILDQIGQDAASTITESDILRVVQRPRKQLT